MISIVIASADAGLLQQVKENVAATIGVPYEILAFANHDGARSISEIYNEGIRLAKHGILCFMHEDISFQTQAWGALVADTFAQQPRVGIIGVAGTTFKSMMPIGWPSEGSPESERCNLVQAYKFSQHETAPRYRNPANETLSSVVVVDGVWICTRKEVTDKYTFDSRTFTGFHGYDIDFCLSAGKDFDIAVVYNIQLLHLSEGNWNRTWIEASLLLQEKWESQLPRSTVPLSAKRIQKIERHNFRFWLQQLHRLGYDRKLAFKILHRPRVRQVVGLKYFLKLHIRVWKTYAAAKDKD